MLKTTQLPKRERGDTLIEVLFAITVFALIVVSSLALMNQGIAASQRSIEITAVRQAMDGQAETLRFLHESYVEAYQTGITFDTTDAVNSPAEEYYKILQSAKKPTSRTVASPFNSGSTCTTPADPSNDFILNPITATYVSALANPNKFENANVYSQLTYSTGEVLNKSQGIWIEAISSPTVAGTSSGYIDFHIRSCWSVPGSNEPMRLGTIVRLYEPRG